jgi:sugar-specific transcriptional regulator TrmB
MKNKGKEGNVMEQSVFMTAGEVSAVLGVSKSKAYGIIRKLNEELDAKGFITVAGRVSRKFFEERFYGLAG